MRNLMSSSNKLFVFGCDLRRSTGEGFLANALLEYLRCFCDVIVYDDPVVRVLCRTPLARDRLLPVYLFFVILAYRVLKRRVVLLNYAPIWNFLNAALVRLGAGIGPITGSVLVLPRRPTLLDRFLRVHLQRVFVKIFLVLYPREKLIWAATPSVMRRLKRENMSEAIFGFPFAAYIDAKKKFSEKKFDIFVYSGRHRIKNHEAALKAVRALSSKNYRVCYVGSDYAAPSSSVSVFESLPEDVFNQHLGQSRMYVSFSFEDSGITGLKALALGVPILCPYQSGLAHMIGNNNKFCYTDPYSIDEILKKSYDILGSSNDYGELAFQYFLGEKSATTKCLEDWLASL